MWIKTSNQKHLLNYLRNPPEQALYLPLKVGCPKTMLIVMTYSQMTTVHQGKSRWTWKMPSIPGMKLTMSSAEMNESILFYSVTWQLLKTQAKTLKTFFFQRDDMPHNIPVYGIFTY